MKTKRDEAFRLVMNQAERKALEKLAENDGTSQAAIVRRLVRNEARERGLWPPPAGQRAGGAAGGA